MRSILVVLGLLPAYNDPGPNNLGGSVGGNPNGG
ncbi:hypothetical protein ACVJGD_004462 [Bradyrhizobium sp. USDA 10063]